MSIFTTDDNETKVTLEEEPARLDENMPFRLLLVGDWRGRGNRSDLLNSNQSERAAIEIDRDNFDEVLQKLSVELSLDLYGEGKDVLHLRFEEIDDFHPDKIFHQVPLFAELSETRKLLINPQTFNQAARNLRLSADKSKTDESQEDAKLSLPSEKQSSAPENLLEQILSQTGESASQKQSLTTSARELNNLISQLVRPYLAEVDETEQAKSVAAVDEATSQLMRMILHQTEFQALEAAWRGLHLLVSRVETDTNLKLYLFDLTKDELTADLNSVGNLSESAFYKLLNNEISNESDNESWTVVCGNFSFQPNVNDTATLMRIAKIAQTTKTVFIAQASPEILGIESLTETLESNQWGLSENKPEGKLWTMLRSLPEASHVGLTIPRFMGRMPYGIKSEPTETFSFEEFLTPQEHDNYLWVNASFACALLLAQSFSLYEWEIGQNLLHDIDNLPVYMYKDAGQTIVKSPVEISLNVSAAEKIIEQGLMPFVSFRDGDNIRLARFQSIAFPPHVLRGRWIS